MHRTVWRYNQADWDRLRHSYKESDWESLITGDPDQSCESVTSLILSGMRKFIPSRALVSRPSDPSWWTPERSESVTAKQRAWKRMTQAPSPQHLQSARQATRSCTAQLQRSGNTYHTAKETTCQGQPHGQAMVVYHQARCRRGTELLLPYNQQSGWNRTCVQ